MVVMISSGGGGGCGGDDNGSFYRYKCSMRQSSQKNTYTGKF